MNNTDLTFDNRCTSDDNIIFEFNVGSNLPIGRDVLNKLTISY